MDIEQNDAVDDFFANTRMPFGEHIEDLRRHLLKALAGSAVALVVGFYLSPPVLDFIAAPVVRELTAFHRRRVEQLHKRLKDGEAQLAAVNEAREVEILIPVTRLRALLRLPDGGDGEWEALPMRVRPLDWSLLTAEAGQLIYRPPALVALSATEGIMVYFKVSIYTGLILSSPWVFYHLWAFVAAGLYPQERRWVHSFLPVSLGLFLGGVALCEFVVLPMGLSYLLSFNEWLGFEPDLRLSEWLGFALFMPLLFGAAFQTPLVMLFLDRLGLVRVEFFRRHRRMAIFVLAVAAAVLSVTPDAVNMLALAVPLWGLYEVGILMCSWWGHPRMLHEEGILDNDGLPKTGTASEDEQESSTDSHVDILA
jgi:sec-independent protein translocase protein TatC